MSELDFDLFGELLEDAWKKEWQDMPEFIQEDLDPKYQIYVSFECLDHLRDFSDLVGQTITENTRSIWYPEAEIGRLSDKRWIDGSVS